MISRLPAPSSVYSISRISAWLAGLGQSCLHLPQQQSILTVPVFPQKDPPEQGRDNAGHERSVLCCGFQKGLQSKPGWTGARSWPHPGNDSAWQRGGPARRSGVELLQIKGSWPREAQIFALCFLCGFGWGSSESRSMLRESSIGASHVQGWLPVGDLWDTLFGLLVII